MLTSKSILVGALVLGAATVPAGLVVTDLGFPAVPPAPGPVVVEAPVVAEASLRLDEPFERILLVPPAPRALEGILEPDVSVPDLSEVELVPVLLLPPAPGAIRSVRAPEATACLDEAGLVRTELVRPDAASSG